MFRVLALLLLLCGAANAGSTIDPTKPAQAASLTSAPVRNNFQAAYSDINNILGVFAGTIAPNSPTALQSWADTSVSPLATFRYWNPTTSTWVAYGTLNMNTGIWSPYGSTTGFLRTPPVTVSVVAGVVTYGLAFDSNFAVVSNNLAFSNVAAGRLLANCTSGSAEPTGCTWTSYADQAIAAVDGSIPTRTGGVWGAAVTGASGHAIPYLDTAALLWGGVQTSYSGVGVLPASLTDTKFRAAGLDGQSPRFESSSFGASGAFTCERASGTLAAQTTLVANDVICSWGGFGYNGTTHGNQGTSIRSVATQTWGVGANGAKVTVATTPNGSVSPVDEVVVDQDGGVLAPATVTGGSKGAGTINMQGGYYVAGSALGFTNIGGVLSLSQIATIATNTALCNATGGTAAPTACSKAQITALVNTFTTSLSGSVCAPGAVTGAFLRDDCTWVAATGTGTVTNVQTVAGTGTTVSGGCNVTISGACTVNVDKATSANLEAGTSNKVLTSDIIFDGEVAITFNATQTLDFSTFMNGRITLTGNITSLTCSNIKNSQSGVISLVQDGTGSRTMVAGWCSQFRWANGTRGILSTAVNAVDALYYQCPGTTICYVSIGKAMAN